MSTAVVHLVWGPLGPGPLGRFIDSYRVQPAGLEHELVVVFNGTSPPQEAELEGRLDGIPHRSLSLRDPVQDLGAYRIAADRLDHDRVCFLNSHSVLATPDWLAKLDAALPAAVPGIAGASGSWMSIRSTYAHLLGLPTGYGSGLPARRTVLAGMRAMNAELREEGGASAPAPMRERLELAARRVLQSPGFPAPHVRTNGFLLSRQLFLDLVASQPQDKLDAYGLEAGPHSLTAQVLERGGEVRVVDSRGRDFRPAEWDTSATFWQQSQQHLLLSDNQTRLFARGDLTRRRILAGWAWGRPELADVANMVR